MRMSRRQFMRGVTATMGAAFYADQAMSEDKRPSEHWMPAEWEPHERTLMQFVPPQNWPARDYPDAAREWATVANAAAEFEPVSIAVRPQDRTLAGRLLSRAIDIVEMPLNDGWSRDSGPIFVHDGRGERRIRGFTFNGWSEKFPPYDADAKVKWRFADRFGWPIDPIKFVLEGGAISVDGEGTLLTTEECLLHPTRNPGFGKAAQETLLKRKLGVEKIIWLGKGISPDPITNGHVDGLCVFVAAGTVLLQTTEDRNDENYAITRDTKRRLRGERDAKGRSLEIIELPLQDDVLHINLYICNGGVIVPTADDPRQDDAPMAILREIFPDRQVDGVTDRVIAGGGGGVHCITQQVPA